MKNTWLWLPLLCLAAALLLAPPQAWAFGHGGGGGGHFGGGGGHFGGGRIGGFRGGDRGFVGRRGLGLGLGLGGVALLGGAAYAYYCNDPDSQYYYTPYCGRDGY